MSASKRQDIVAFRRDPFQVVLAVTGVDLTNAAPSLAVRRNPDAAGDPLLLLTSTTTAGAQGIRLIGIITDDDGVVTSLLEVIATKASMAALPPAAEVGLDLILAYDLQWTPPDDWSGITAVETTVLFGSFIVKGSVNG